MRLGYPRLTMARLSNCVILIGLSLSLSTATGAQTNDPLKEAQRLTRVAQVAEQQGRHEDAIKAYETISLIAKNSPKLAAKALLTAGKLYMTIGRFEIAAKSFRASLALDATSADAENSLGEALGELKQYQSALAAFQQAVALDGAFIKARFNMGVTYDKLGQLKYAEFIYRILIRDYPDFALAYDSLAVTLSKSGRAREAIPFHQKAINLNRGNPSFYYNSALTFLMLGDLKNAEEQKQRLQALDPAAAEHLASLISKREK